jgi:phosphofructokinase-like protein
MKILIESKKNDMNIGVLTSGGDCAGLNAVIRSITLHAQTSYGYRVIGIHKGTTGLISRPLDYQELTLESCDFNMLRTGGTMLGTTNKDNPFFFPTLDGGVEDRSSLFYEGYHDLQLDALIGIGGDGSMKILRRLSVEGNLNFVGIPKTIDNDIGLTEEAIGYSTSLSVVTQALDHLQPTAASHQRVMVLEVMGRDAGNIALAGGIAGGADIILIPEIPYKLENIKRKIESINKEKRNFALVVVAESVRDENGNKITLSGPSDPRVRYGGIGHYLGDKITEMTHAETRVTVLGHIQRGGQPNARDRVLASALGVHAVDLISQRKFDRMVAWQHRDVVDVPLKDSIEGYKKLNNNDILVKTARGLNICLGDL